LNEVLIKKVLNNEVIDSKALFKHFCFVVSWMQCIQNQIIWIIF
jgi:hypothetical protein